MEAHAVVGDREYPAIAVASRGDENPGVRNPVSGERVLVYVGERLIQQQSAVQEFLAVRVDRFELEFQVDRWAPGPVRAVDREAEPTQIVRQLDVAVVG